MARCKNGTRRNKKTGNCEAKKTGTRKRCPNGSRFDKKTNGCTKATTRTKGKKSTEKLTSEQFDQIVDYYRFKQSDPKKYAEIVKLKPKILKLKYDENYISSFTGEKTKNIYDMVHAKVGEWSKYGDPIV